MLNKYLKTFPPGISNTKNTRECHMTVNIVINGDTLYFGHMFADGVHFYLIFNIETSVL